MSENMGMFTQLKIRSMAAVDAWLFRGGQANWSTWTLANAVKDGYKRSGWVYRAVSMVARNAASVPWVVFNEENEIEHDHPLTQMFKNPNPHFSRQDLFELLIAWHQLSGEAYLQRVFVDGGRTKELWPISPDRIAPISSKDSGALVSGYSIRTDGGATTTSTDYTVENMIHFKMLDPSNPLKGIGPLQAASRAVDTDTEQQDWNKSAMQNRGVMDGVFTFKRDLDEKQHGFILKKIKERFSGAENARTPGVVGSDASYTRMSITPAEMDFINSRKFNREEIFIVFGVPPQLAGVMDTATYNNFLVSLRIFWENTIIPLLDDMADTFNNEMRDELENGKYRIGYDTSNVTALRESENEKAKTAKSYWDMGVPVANLNEKMELGLEEFTDWDLPWSGKAPNQGNNNNNNQGGEDTEKKSSKAPQERRYWSLVPQELRNYQQEQTDRDKMAEGFVREMFSTLLVEQRGKILEAVENKEDPVEVIKASHDTWLKQMRQTAQYVAQRFAGTVVVGERGRKPGLEHRDEYDDLIADRIDGYLVDENIMLQDLSHLEQTTAQAVIDQVADAANTGATVVEIQQALEDLGVFSEERALMLARTLAGTAASVGQMSGAEVAGAKTKEWMNSGFEVRDIHVERGGERVDMDKRFSDKGYGEPRFPLDPTLGPADRVNCRCSTVFE